MSQLHNVQHRPMDPCRPHRSHTCRLRRPWSGMVTLCICEEILMAGTPRVEAASAITSGCHNGISRCGVRGKELTSW